MYGDNWDVLILISSSGNSKYVVNAAANTNVSLLDCSALLGFETGKRLESIQTFQKIRQI